jgi:hypothetical protein
MDFDIDLDEQGRSVVAAYITIDGQKERIKNIQEAWNYGYIFRRGNKRYSISLESLEMISSMKSVNPTVTEDGSMIFEICPTV